MSGTQSQGFGHFEYQNGTVYEGQWVELESGEKVKHGEGTLIHSGTTAYEKGNESYNGNWSYDKMEGYGIYNYTSGAVYSGEWMDNQHHGKGIYEFPDGSIYDGQWQKHRLHGEGVYIDREGNKWEGEFVDGVFQSKMQKILKNEKIIKQKETVILDSVTQILAKFITAYQQSDKKTYKDNLSQFFIQGDEASIFVNDINLKYESQTVEKWAEIFTIIKETGVPTVLRNNQMTSVLKPEQIVAQQLNGPGQIVDYSSSTNERLVQLSFVNIYEDNWAIIAVNDIKK